MLVLLQTISSSLLCCRNFLTFCVIVVASDSQVARRSLKPLTLARLSGGDCFGEESIFRPEGRFFDSFSCSVITHTRVRLLFFAREM
jgi:CRP-like cAMP-binding protein